MKEKYGHSLGIKGHLQKVHYTFIHTYILYLFESLQLSCMYILKEGTKDSASVELSEDMDNKAGDEDLVVEEYFSDDECRRPSAADSDE